MPEEASSIIDKFIVSFIPNPDGNQEYLSPSIKAREDKANHGVIMTPAYVLGLFRDNEKFDVEARGLVVNMSARQLYDHPKLGPQLKCYHDYNIFNKWWKGTFRKAFRDRHPNTANGNISFGTAVDTAAAEPNEKVATGAIDSHDGLSCAGLEESFYFDASDDVSLLDNSHVDPSIHADASDEDTKVKAEGKTGNETDQADATADDVSLLDNSHVDPSGHADAIAVTAAVTAAVPSIDGHDDTGNTLDFALELAGYCKSSDDVKWTLALANGEEVPEEFFGTVQESKIFYGLIRSLSKMSSTDQKVCCGWIKNIVKGKEQKEKKWKELMEIRNFTDYHLAEAYKLMGIPPPIPVEEQEQEFFAVDWESVESVN